VSPTSLDQRTAGPRRRANPTAERHLAARYLNDALALRLFLEADDDLDRHPERRRLTLTTLRFGAEITTFSAARQATEDALEALDRRLPAGLGPYFLAGPCPHPRRSLWHAHVVAETGFIGQGTQRATLRAVGGLDQRPGRGLSVQWWRQRDEAAFTRGGRLLQDKDFATPAIAAQVLALNVDHALYVADNLVRAYRTTPPRTRPWIESPNFSTWPGFAAFRDFHLPHVLGRRAGGRTGAVPNLPTCLDEERRLASGMAWRADGLVTTLGAEHGRLAQEEKDRALDAERAGLLQSLLA